MTYFILGSLVYLGIIGALSIDTNEKYGYYAVKFEPSPYTVQKDTIFDAQVKSSGEGYSNATYPIS